MSASVGRESTDGATTQDKLDLALDEQHPPDCAGLATQHFSTTRATPRSRVDAIKKVFVAVRLVGSATDDGGRHTHYFKPGEGNEMAAPQQQRRDAASSMPIHGCERHPGTEYGNADVLRTADIRAEAHRSRTRVGGGSRPTELNRGKLAPDGR